MNYFELNDEANIINTVEASAILEVSSNTNTLTKSEIVKSLYQRSKLRQESKTDNLPLSKYESRELVESFFEEIRAELLAGRAVKLSGFGNFEIRNKNARPGRNPRTGEFVPIAARTVVNFYPSMKLKIQLNK